MANYIKDLQAQNAWLEQQLTEVRTDLVNGILGYTQSEKFAGVGNGHVATEDINLRVHEILRAMQDREAYGPEPGLACDLDTTHIHIAEQPWPELRQTCGVCGRKLDGWHRIRVGRCYEHIAFLREGERHMAKEGVTV